MIYRLFFLLPVNHNLILQITCKSKIIKIWFTGFLKIILYNSTAILTLDLTRRPWALAWCKGPPVRPFIHFHSSTVISRDLTVKWAATAACPAPIRPTRCRCASTRSICSRKTRVVNRHISWPTRCGAGSIGTGAITSILRVTKDISWPSRSPTTRWASRVASQAPERCRTLSPPPTSSSKAILEANQMQIRANTMQI